MVWNLAFTLQADEKTEALFADLTEALKANTRALNFNTGVLKCKDI
jgi:hypothetical protein